MNTNIDISDALVNELHRRAPCLDERSTLLEKILTEYFRTHPPNQQSELSLINAHANELNEEATNVLAFSKI
jgi:hypothetical protein